MISEIDLRLRPEIAGTPELLKREVARQLKVKTDAINEWRVTRRSVDARKPQVYVNLRVMAATGKDRKITPAFEPE